MYTLTGAGHRGGVSLRTKVVFLTATVQRPLMVGEAVRRTLGALHVAERRFVESCPARWRQKNTDPYMSIMQNQLMDSSVIASFLFRSPAMIAKE